MAVVARVRVVWRWWLVVSAVVGLVVEGGLDVGAGGGGGGGVALGLWLSCGAGGGWGGGGGGGGGGGMALRYGGLSALDARGRSLPARLEVAAGRLLVRVDD